MDTYYYVGTESDIALALNQINSNCGFPSPSAATWAVPQKAYQAEFWFIRMPPEIGYKNKYIDLTQAEMIAGVKNVTAELSDPSWFEPVNP